MNRPHLPNDEYLYQFYQAIQTKDGKSHLLSRRKTADLLGVSEAAISSYVRRHLKHVDTSSGLDIPTMTALTHYFAMEARNPTKRAIRLHNAFASFGAELFYRSLDTVDVIKNPR